MGAVSFAVGAEGSTYIVDGTTYTLSGWTLGAIADHERFLEQRAYDAITRIKMMPDARAQATAVLAEDIACFAFAFGGERFGKSLTTVAGCTHFAWKLLLPAHAELKMADVQKLVEADPEKMLEAVYSADPRNRATAA